MCGRYNLVDNDDTQSLMDDLKVSIGRTDITDFYNLAPTDQIPVIYEEDGARALRPMKWWLTPGWAKEVTTRYSMFNARAESLERSKAFKGSFRHHRIIIPMTSFIEWREKESTRRPYLIKYLKGCMAAAGIWSQWTDGNIVLDTCAMITTSALSEFKFIHSRQPLLLNSFQANIWLKEKSDLINLRKILRSSLPQNISLKQIATTINNSRLKEPPRYLINYPEIIIQASK